VILNIPKTVELWFIYNPEEPSCRPIYEYAHVRFDPISLRCTIKLLPPEPYAPEVWKVNAELLNDILKQIKEPYRISYFWWLLPKEQPPDLINDKNLVHNEPFVYDFS